MTPFFDDRVAQWVAKHIPDCSRGFGNCRALGVEHNGQVVAGVVFHNWDPVSGVIELSSAATDRRWMTRNVMSTVFDYVFDGLKCQLAVARTHEDNMTVRKLWKALGADEYLIPRLRGRDAAEAIETLTEESWKRSKFYISS